MIVVRCVRPLVICTEKSGVTTLRLEVHSCDAGNDHCHFFLVMTCIFTYFELFYVVLACGGTSGVHLTLSSLAVAYFQYFYSLFSSLLLCFIIFSPTFSYIPVRQTLVSPIIFVSGTYPTVGPAGYT